MEEVFNLTFLQSKIFNFKKNWKPTLVAASSQFPDSIKLIIKPVKVNYMRRVNAKTCNKLK